MVIRRANRRQYRRTRRAERIGIVVFLVLYTLFFFSHSVNAETHVQTFDLKGEYLSEKGQTLSLDDMFRIGIFPHAVDIDVHLRLEKITPSTEMLRKLPEGKQMISDMYLYDILPVDPSLHVDPFRYKQAAITIEYDRSIEYVNKGIYYWDNNKKDWIRLYSNKRRFTNTVAGYIHLPFSRVVVLADKPETLIYNDINFGNIKPLPLDAQTESYLLVSEDEHRILAAQNIYDEYPIASLTKLMTAIILSDEGVSADMDKVLTYNSRKHYAYANFLGLRDGEKVTVKDLYYSMLISSLNVPTRMLVETTQYTEHDFINRMNSKAKSLGLYNTNFHDTSGLSFRNHSTVYDLYRLFDHAYQDSLIRETLIIPQYEFDEVLSLDTREYHLLINRNKLIGGDNNITILGGKTGYTEEALSCFIVRFLKDGKEYTLVTLGNPNYNARFADSIRIINSIDGLFVAHK